MLEYRDLPPSPSSLIESMRDLGYSIETAVADIIDNSITAHASIINIRFSWNNSKPWIGFIDNGCGMSSEELFAAMRLGSSNPLDMRNVDDLGRFGLGLKTASFSQCRCLTVLSKKKNNVFCAQWDLENISKCENNQWLLCVFNEKDIKDEILTSLKTEYLDNQESGTIVLWNNIDRIVEKGAVSLQEKSFNESLSVVREHLELIFHRFIVPERGKSKIKFLFNRDELEAFDPFNSLKSTECHLDKFKFENEVIKVQPYVLPHHNKVNTVEWNKYAGKRGYLDSQGFYVYRNRRLIIHSTWFKIIKREELTKLVRIRVDIPNALDHLWRIDIKKSSAFPPIAIREELKRIISKTEYIGKNVYKQRGQHLISSIKDPAWNRIAKEEQIYYQINRKHPLVEKHLTHLTDSQKELFTDILDTLESSFPRDSYYSDVSSTPEQVHSIKLDRQAIEKLLDIFDISEYSTKKRLREILQMDPFASSSNILVTKSIFKERGYEYE